ncbi:MAG TPA: CBS domain-containing protein [Terriglobales bacterium]|nr:CBS domain-containing protein [Terriglobales bacterium]
MARVAELVKDRRALSVSADQSVLEASRLMTEFNVGAVPVMRDDELTGIFSERDLMRRVVAAGRSPATTRVSEVMTARPVVLAPDDSVEHAMFVMQEHGFRHLVVCDGKTLKGVISLRDVMHSQQRAKSA